MSLRAESQHEYNVSYVRVGRAVMNLKKPCSARMLEDVEVRFDLLERLINPGTLLGHSLRRVANLNGVPRRRIRVARGNDGERRSEIEPNGCAKAETASNGSNQEQTLL